MNLNPFQFIFESPYFPHARTRRTSLLQKFKDTFNVFTGFFNEENDAQQTLFDFLAVDLRLNEFNLGLFDYLTLGLPLLLTWGLQQAEKLIPPGKMQITAHYLQSAVNFLFNLLPRVGLGVMITFFVSGLLILPTAFFAYLSSHQIRKMMLELPGKVVKEPEGSTENLNDYLIFDLTDKPLTYFADQECYESKVVKLTPSLTYCLKINYKQQSEEEGFRAEINAENLQYIQALLEINFAHAIDALQQRAEKDEHFRQHIKTLNVSNNCFFKALTEIESETTPKINPANH